MQFTCTLPPDSERNEKPAESEGKAEEKLLPAVTYCRWQQQQRPATNPRNGKYDPSTVAKQDCKRISDECHNFCPSPSLLYKMYTRKR